MNERAWLAYRLDVVSAWPESPRKRASVRAIHDALAALSRQEEYRLARGAGA